MTTSDSLSNGGPAFPHDNQELGDKHRVAQPGMSLRDAFALAVAPTLVEQFQLIRTLDPEARDHARAMKNFAEGAYRLADAMLKAREVKNV